MRRRSTMSLVGTAAGIILAGCSASNVAKELEPLPRDGNMFEQFRQDRGIPGLGAAVALRGREPRIFVSGVANIRSGQAVTAQTLFHYFSLTKLFTTVAILQLVERQQVRLEGDVREYLPELVLRQGFAGELGALTIENLLSHCSGFGRETDSLGFHFPHEAAPSTQALLQILLRHELKFKPGAQCSYSNINFALLAAVIERVSSQSFEAYLRREVLLPLGMTATDFSYAAVDSRNAASGYVGRWSLMDLMLSYLLPRKRRAELMVDCPLLGNCELNLFELDAKGYGGMIGTIEDLGKFLAFQLDEGEARHQAVLGLPMRRRMLQRGLGAYSLGWATDCAGPGTYGHVGGGPGFKATVCMAPKAGWAVAVLTNKFVGSDPSIAAILQSLGSGATPTGVTP